MTEYVDVSTQAELDAALKRKGVIPVCRGNGHFVLGSASVRAFGSASVRASGSASVEAFGSASVRAFDSASVRAFDSASVRASKYVSVHRHGDQAKVTGGVLIQVPQITTAEEWCDFYGVEVNRRGVATLYKAVGEDFRSNWGLAYTPGTKPKAPDWDGGKRECGGGLHFAPRPALALQFISCDDVRFVACPVRVKDIHVTADAVFSNKVKAEGVCAPVYEVDIDGERI